MAALFRTLIEKNLYSSGTLRTLVFTDGKHKRFHDSFSNLCFNIGLMLLEKAVQPARYFSMSQGPCPRHSPMVIRTNYGGCGNIRRLVLNLYDIELAMLMKCHLICKNNPFSQRDKQMQNQIKLTMGTYFASIDPTIRIVVYPKSHLHHKI